MTQETEEPQAADWRAQITSDDHRRFAETSPDLDHLVGRALEMRQKLSTAIVRPGKDARPEEIASYRRAMGVPETPDAYRFEPVPGVEPTETEQGFRGAMAQVFHTAGLSVDQVSSINRGWNALVSAQLEQTKQADEAHRQASEAQLRRDWPGEEFGRNREFANRAAERLFGSDYEAARQLEDRAGRFILDHPIMMRLLASVGREMGEGELGSVLADRDRSSVQEQIDALQSQKMDALQQGDHEQANTFDARQADLYRRLHGAKR